MRSAEPYISGRIKAGALLSMLLAGVMPLVPAFAHQADSPMALGKTKSMAETQHEIVMLLIKKKEYERAETEANKIFDMKWPEDQEPLLLKELLILSDQFLQCGQAKLGLYLINNNSKCFRQVPSRVKILKEMGYLYKSLGQNDKALDCFQKARNLEKGN
jgi:tetratricopeptide (TPR) repeat protein